MIDTLDFILNLKPHRWSLEVVITHKQKVYACQSLKNQIETQSDVAISKEEFRNECPHYTPSKALCSDM